MRNPLCSVCHIRPKTKGQVYCLECRRAHKREEYAKKSRGTLANCLKTMYWGAKSRAIKRGLKFTIKWEHIAIPEYCPILGLKLKANLGKGYHPDSPSLDRIIPSKGYIPGNVQVISNRANAIKTDATLDELTILGQWAYRSILNKACKGLGK